jgi:protein NrfD
MIDAPSSTWFTSSPHWQWLIVAHFMLSALASGTYFLSAMIDLVGRESDRRLARLGYLITLPLLAVVGVVLIVDLGRPDRFWHLFIANHTLMPMFKYWVPMSVGSWAVTALGFFALLSFIAAFAEQRHRDWKFARRLRPPGLVGILVAVPGAFFALVVTGYTGVMISVLNRPIWSDSPLYGMLFLVSAVTMAAALLVLGARWLGWQSPGVAALQRILVSLLVVQVLVLTAQFIWLGPAARAWLSVWGIVLAIGIVIGILLPLVAGFGRRWLGESGVPAAAAMVLVGGLILRTAVVFAPDAVAP